LVRVSALATVPRVMRLDAEAKPATAEIGTWEMRAACRGPASAPFFPPITAETSGARRRREAAAKRICSDCPVRSECLEYALRVREPFGIWGGRTEAERRDLSSAIAG
jgi:WhiB family transcriptional regulator, redox-sensing transcriptional regulator